MIGETASIAQRGSEFIITKVESSIGNGIPEFKIIGLADTAIKESVARVKSAIINSGFKFPPNKIIVNLMPASFSKKGSHFDLAIAISILKSSGQIGQFESREFAFFGELSLKGEVTGIEELLPHIIEGERLGFRKIFIPKEGNNYSELIKSEKIECVSSLKDVIDKIERYGKAGINIQKNKSSNNIEFLGGRKEPPRNLSEEKIIDTIIGQEEVKRAILISAAGGHSILMVGSPGVGKTQMAQMYRYILPELNYEDALEVMKIYSLSNNFGERKNSIFIPPFRKANISISKASMLGGGVVVKPGEVSLAHKGVIFLDELPNFSKDVLKNLIQIIDEKKVIIRREKAVFTFPADFILVTAMNPCRCGYYGDDFHSCKCSQSEILSYTKNITGPLLDRIDIKIRVNRINSEKWEENSYVAEGKLIDESNKDRGCARMSILHMKKLVAEARKFQEERNKRYIKQSENNNCLNGSIEDEEVEHICKLGREERQFLKKAYEKLAISHRGYKQVLKLSRTIADLEKAENIGINHIAEALRYRNDNIFI